MMPTLTMERDGDYCRRLEVETAEDGVVIWESEEEDGLPRHLTRLAIPFACAELVAAAIMRAVQPPLPLVLEDAP